MECLLSFAFFLRSRPDAFCTKARSAEGAHDATRPAECACFEAVAWRHPFMADRDRNLVQMMELSVVGPELRVRFREYIRRKYCVRLTVTFLPPSYVHGYDVPDTHGRDYCPRKCPQIRLVELFRWKVRRGMLRPSFLPSNKHFSNSAYPGRPRQHAVFCERRGRSPEIAR